jgi:hypothetical protein
VGPRAVLDAVVKRKIPGSSYSKVGIGKYLSGAFHIQNDLKQGGVLSPSLYNFDLEYAIGKVREG